MPTAGLGKRCQLGTVALEERQARQFPLEAFSPGGSPAGGFWVFERSRVPCVYKYEQVRTKGTVGALGVSWSPVCSWKPDIYPPQLLLSRNMGSSRIK
jgi:hypothetical protein